MTETYTTPTTQEPSKRHRARVAVSRLSKLLVLKKGLALGLVFCGLLVASGCSDNFETAITPVPGTTPAAVAVEAGPAPLPPDGATKLKGALEQSNIPASEADCANSKMAETPAAAAAVQMSNVTGATTKAFVDIMTSCMDAGDVVKVINQLNSNPGSAENQCLTNKMVGWSPEQIAGYLANDLAALENKATDLQECAGLKDTLKP